MSKKYMTRPELLDWVDKNLEGFDRQEILFLDFDGPSPVEEDVRLESWTTLRTDDLRHMEVFEKLPHRLHKIFMWAINRSSNVYELAQAYKDLSSISVEELKSANAVLKSFQYKRYDYDFLAEFNPEVEMVLDLLVYIVNNNHILYTRKVSAIRRLIVMRVYESNPQRFFNSQEFKRLVDSAE